MRKKSQDLYSDIIGFHSLSISLSPSFIFIFRRWRCKIWWVSASYKELGRSSILIECLPARTLKSMVAVRKFMQQDAMNVIRIVEYIVLSGADTRCHKGKLIGDMTGVNLFWFKAGRLYVSPSSIPRSLAITGHTWEEEEKFWGQVWDLLTDLISAINSDFLQPACCCVSMSRTHQTLSWESILLICSQ